MHVYARKWINWVTSKDVMSLTNAHENQLYDVIKRHVFALFINEYTHIWTYKHKLS
jgi:hypothetical protein